MSRVLPWSLLVLAVVVLLVIGYNSDPFGWRRGALTKAQQGQATATGQAAVATGQAAASSDAAAILDAGRPRDTRTIVIRETNRDQILSAPGATTPLDLELVRRARVGLCNYRAHAGDAGCAEVRPVGAGELPAASQTGASATP